MNASIVPNPRSSASQIHGVAAETLSRTSRIDALRKEVTQSTIEAVRTTVSQTTSVTSREELAKLLLVYFPGHNHRPIRDFFSSHPIRWFDLIRKLSKHRKNDSQRGWYVDESAIEDIYTTFVVRWRADSLGAKLQAVLPGVISENQDLLRYASTQPSILDSEGYSFSKLQKRDSLIRKLVLNGFIHNIDGCTYEDVDKHFGKVFPEILRNLDAIFGIQIPLRYCQDSAHLIRKLSEMVKSPRGVERENAFRVIQAIHAWSGLGYIQELHDMAEGAIQKLPDALGNVGIRIQDVTQEARDGTIIYESHFTYGGREYGISWRIKSVMSVLQKQWESEEYTNVDAMRDMLGISIIYPDDVSQSEIIELTSWIASLMPNFGYILKDKGALKDGIFDVEKRARERGKPPAFVTTKRGSSTNGNFENTSVSGFMQFGKTSIGTEFQVMSESVAEWKKGVDDKKYKLRSAIEAMVRWPKFCTPYECFRLLNKRIQPSELHQLGHSSINGLIFEMMKENFLIPFVSGDGDTLLFTTKDKIPRFLERFTAPHSTEKLRMCDYANPHYEKMCAYVNSLI